MKYAFLLFRYSKNLLTWLGRCFFELLLGGDGFLTTSPCFSPEFSYVYVLLIRRDCDV